MLLEEKIEQLEKRIADLESRPVYVPYPVYPALPAPLPYQGPYYQPQWINTCQYTT